MQVVHQSRPVVPRDRFIRLPEVENLIGCKKSTIYTMLEKGTFPRPIRHSARMVVWPESAVLQWLQDRIKDADTHPQPTSHGANPRNSSGVRS